MIKQRQQPAGYGENNPEPAEFKGQTASRDDLPDALHADSEYINGQAEDTDEKPHMPCKSSLPT